MAHLTLLLVLLWVGSTVSSVEDLHKRIIGGKECVRKYHVKLRAVSTEGCGLCGGSLISKQWILTAAHCWQKGWIMFANVRDQKLRRDQLVQIKEDPVIYKDGDGQHDLMLLKLPIPSEDKPVALADCPKDSKGYPKKVQAAGYAATCGNPDGTRILGEVETLNCADFDVVDCENLKNHLQNTKPEFYKDWKHQHWRCAYTDKKDISKGDSGGGVVDGGKIYGVLSFTGDEKYALKQPFGFIDLCNKKYSDWISKTIKG